MAKSTAKPDKFEKATLNKLKRLIESKSRDLAWHHKVGQLVNKLAPKGKNNFGKMKELVELIDGKSKRVTIVALNAARDFSRTCHKRDLAALKELSFTHVCRLITVESTQRRDW